MIGSSSRDIRATVDVDIPGGPVAIPLTVWSTFGEWREHPTVGPQLEKLLAARGGIRGRMADLLSDETGQDSVLNVPMQSRLEFPGVPLTADDASAWSLKRHNDACRLGHDGVQSWAGFRKIG